MRILRPQGSARFVLLCDHASNFVPVDLHDLGLPSSELQRHIAWDIGAAGVTEVLSELLDAPAVLCGTSRLVIDCNRQLHAADLIPEVSDGTAIPGNAGLSEAARAKRVASFFHPYHDAVESAVQEHHTVVSIHSMTPVMRGVERPWQIALSSSPLFDRSVTDRVLRGLREPGDVVVGDNQPYDMDPEVDYSTPVHALRRGLPFVQVEFRQDEIADAAGQNLWARRFAKALTAAVRQP